MQNTRPYLQCFSPALCPNPAHFSRRESNPTLTLAGLAGAGAQAEAWGIIFIGCRGVYAGVTAAQFDHG